MKKVTVLHTVKSVCNSFEVRMKAKIGQPLEITNLLDEFLVTNARKKGFFPPENRKKLYLDLLSASLENPDLIVVTCSSLTPFVQELRPSFDVPIITIDERMCRNAALAGKVIGVMATAPTTVAPTVSGIQAAAEALGCSVEIRTLLDEEAMTMLKGGDEKGHDARLAARSVELNGVDAIVLAQASMATAAGAVEKATGLRVITSPDSCIEDILEGLE